MEVLINISDEYINKLVLRKKISWLALRGSILSEEKKIKNPKQNYSKYENPDIPIP